MNFKNFFFIPFVVLLIGCSTDNDDIDPHPDFETQLIKSTEGRNGLNLQYHNGLPTKALVLGYGEQDFYSVAMEIQYNENNRVARVIMDVEGNYPIEAGFDFNLDPELWENKIFDYHYEDGRLINITNKSGTIVHRFLYDSEGRVKEVQRSITYLPAPNTWVKTKYGYSDSGYLNYYSKENGWEEEVLEGEISVDGRANPFHILWKEFSLVFPKHFNNSFYENNNPYQPFNILEKYKGSNLEYKASFKYDGNYPSRVFIEVINGTVMAEQLSPSLDLNFIYD